VDRRRMRTGTLAVSAITDYGMPALREALCAAG
jgi:hypothetical protein